MEYASGPICGVDNCRSRRYRQAEDGFTYCYYGHKRDAGLVTVDEDFQRGQTYSQTTRRRIGDPEEPVEKVLGSRAMMILCLQCFQLILWKQASWLVKVKKYPQELETIVRDLWVLRLQMLQALLEDPDETRATKLFSTQSDTENSDAEKGKPSVSQASLRQSAPRLMESVAICYLGLVLLRLPVCARDVHGWIMSEGFTYLSALTELPQEMKQQLSLSMKSKFYVKIGAAKLDKFHQTVMSLVQAFKSSADMIFPPLNHHLLLFRFISDLALPLDVFPAAEHLSRILEHDFSFPSRFIGRKQIRIHQYPEIQLLCTLIVATKLLFPFDSDRVLRHPTSPTSLAALVIDWQVWNDARARHAGGEESREKGAERKNAKLLNTKEDDVFGMSGADVDKYLDWFDKTWIGGRSATDENERDEVIASSSWQGRRSTAHTEFRKALFRFFPSGPGEEVRRRTEQAARETMSAEEDADETPVGEWEANGADFYDMATQARIDRIREVQSTLQARITIVDTVLPPEGEGASNGPASAQSRAPVLRPGSRYETYKTVETLPEIAKVFFEDSAKLVGLSVKDLLVAVNQVESKLQKWAAAERDKTMTKKKRGRPRKARPGDPGWDANADSRATVQKSKAKKPPSGRGPGRPRQPKPFDTDMDKQDNPNGVSHGHVHSDAHIDAPGVAPNSGNGYIGMGR